MTDAVLTEIADYALRGPAPDDARCAAARVALRDALACALLALRDPACLRRVGPLVPGATLPGGARVPGTSFELDPVQATFSAGTLVRWLDFNDTWLAAEWGHPSDNIAGILAVGDWLARRARMEGREPPRMRSLLGHLLRAYEIQGVLALANPLNRAGLDHVVLVRVATAAVVAAMLGAAQSAVTAALCHAFLDGAPLRAYRHAPNAGPRKGWAAADAASRGVWLALLAMRGEPGAPAPLSAPTWGYSDALLGGAPLRLAQPLGSYVLDNILYKVSHPAEFHAQSAVEAALALHRQMGTRIDAIERIVIETQEPALRIIDKRGPLANVADRDHCLQYVVAAALLHGRLGMGDCEDGVAADPRIDALRERMEVRENPQFTARYHDARLRHVGNALQVFFRDGSASERVEVSAPLGHPSRRAEALPLLEAKFESAVAGHFGARQAKAVLALFADPARFDALPVNEFVAALVTNHALPGKT